MSDDAEPEDSSAVDSHPVYDAEELRAIDRALSDYLNPYLNPMIRGAGPDDEGIPEMTRAWEKTRDHLYSGTGEGSPEDTRESGEGATAGPGIYVAFRCSACGFVYENAQTNQVNVGIGDHCLKCGAEYTADDRWTRTSDVDFPWEVSPD